MVVWDNRNARLGRARPSARRWTLRGRARARRLAVATVLSLGLAQGGCGTLITQIDGPLFAPTTTRAFDWDQKKVTPVYAGTRLSFGGARKSEIKPMWIADLPFSLVADTIILPLTLIQEGIWRFFGPDDEEILRPKATESS